MMTLKELKNLLKKYDISTKKWGVGSAKSIDNLLNEINNQECFLIEEGAILTRTLQFVSVKIYYTDGKDYYILVEDRQEFKDGRVRKRSVSGSVSEKMIEGETPEESAVRGVKEELGIDIIKQNLYNYRTMKMFQASESYPELLSNYHAHTFAYNFNSGQYNPRGYKEVQDNLTTYFIWEKRK